MTKLDDTYLILELENIIRNTGSNLPLDVDNKELAAAKLMVEPLCILFEALGKGDRENNLLIEIKNYKKELEIVNDAFDSANEEVQHLEEKLAKTLEANTKMQNEILKMQDVYMSANAKLKESFELINQGLADEIIWLRSLVEKVVK